MAIEKDQERFDRLLIEVDKVGGRVILNSWPGKKTQKVPATGSNYGDIAKMLRDVVVENQSMVEIIIAPNRSTQEEFIAKWIKGEHEPNTDIIRFNDNGAFIFDPPTAGTPYVWVKSPKSVDGNKKRSIVDHILDWLFNKLAAGIIVGVAVGFILGRIS